MEPAKLTIAEMIYRAISYRNQLGELKLTRFVKRTALLPGLAAMLKQCDGVGWILTAIASWVAYGECGETDSDLGFGQVGKSLNEYRWLVEKWPSLHALQYFELHRYGPCGARLYVRGGLDDWDDDSLSLYPIQRWENVELPWSDDEPLCVWAESLENGEWALMLPSEFYDLIFPSTKW